MAAVACLEHPSAPKLHNVVYACAAIALWTQHNLLHAVGECQSRQCKGTSQLSLQELTCELSMDTSCLHLIWHSTHKFLAASQKCGQAGACLVHGKCIRAHKGALYGRRRAGPCGVQKPPSPLQQRGASWGLSGPTRASVSSSAKEAPRTMVSRVCAQAVLTELHTGTPPLASSSATAFCSCTSCSALRPLFPRPCHTHRGPQVCLRLEASNRFASVHMFQRHGLFSDSGAYLDP